MTISAASIVAALSLIGFVSVVVIPRHDAARCCQLLGVLGGNVCDLLPHVFHGVNSLLNANVPLEAQGAELAFVIVPLVQHNHGRFVNRCVADEHGGSQEAIPFDQFAKVREPHQFNGSFGHSNFLSGRIR